MCAASDSASPRTLHDPPACRDRVVARCSERAREPCAWSPPAPARPSDFLARDQRYALPRHNSVLRLEARPLIDPHRVVVVIEDIEHHQWEALRKEVRRQRSSQSRARPLAASG